MNIFATPEDLSESLIKPIDIDASRLAAELKIETYRLPDTYPTQARELLKDFYQNFGLKTLTIPSESLGDFLAENKDAIMSHFTQYPDMWRWPLALLDEDVDNEITLPLMQGVTFRNIPREAFQDPKILKNIDDCPIPKETSEEEIRDIIARALDNTIVILCFATFIMRCERFSSVTKKYTGRMLNKTETLSLVEDEGLYELETVWGSRYVSVITRILGRERALGYSNQAQKNTLEVVDRNFYERERASYWRRNLPYERVLVENPGSQENAARDLEGFNFFLCQNHIYGYAPLVLGMATNSQAHHDNWTVWIRRYIDKIADRTTETHKVCKYVFQITGDIFVDGQLSEEARIQIPEHLQGVFETALKKHLKRHSQPHIGHTVHAIITQKTPEIQPKITLKGVEWSTNTNTLKFTQGVPTNTHKIEIRIYKNNKVVGFGIHEGADISTLCLIEDAFQNQIISAEKPLLLGQAFSYTPGERYSLGITAQTRSGKTEEFRTETFIIPKAKKEQSPPSRKFSHVPRIQERITTIIPNHPHKTQDIGQQATTSADQPKDARESEKEDLQTAIDFFLDKTDQELQRFFEEHSFWDEETRSLTLSIPIEELEEIGYTPSLLSVEEFGPMIQWSAKKEHNGWISVTGDDIPKKISPQFDTLFLALDHKRNKAIIDDELSSLGLRPSDTDDNKRLRDAIHIEENIDIKKLLARITEISQKYTEKNIPFNLYHKPGKNPKVPQSISLLSKGNWLATLTLQPTIDIKILPIKTPLPHDEKLFAQRIENALLNFIYHSIKNGKGISSIITRTTLQEDTNRLRESYRRDLKKKTARLLIENPDGVTFSILGDISSEGLKDAIKQAQEMYGVEKVALLYRRNTYAFVGDTSICKPSQYNSDDDYMSLNIAERKGIIKDRILKTLFNGKSGILDRAPFIYGSAVYHALQFEVKAFQDKIGRNILPTDISDSFIDEFIEILRSREVLISYRDYCAGWVEDLTDLCAE